MRNPYVPIKAKVEKVWDEARDIRTFRLRPLDGEIRFEPGQFVEVSVFGAGEIPISIASDPEVSEYIELSVRRVGRVTSAMFRLKEGDLVGIRGPYGNGWPLKESRGRDILIVGGGCGAGALRSAILWITKHREDYGKVEILYGARTPADLMYRREFEGLREGGTCRVLLTVDYVPEGVEWRYDVGVVTKLFKKVTVNPREAVAFICGPEIMMKFAVRGLVSMGFKIGNIYLSMERRMKCGLGLCGHCQIGNKYVCQDGPVFCYEEIIPLPDKIL